MPAWMALLHASVTSKETPQYPRLFLVKAVLHVEARHTARAAAEQSEVGALETHGTVFKGMWRVTPLNVHCLLQ